MDTTEQNSVQPAADSAPIATVSGSGTPSGKHPDGQWEPVEELDVDTAMAYARELHKRDVDIAGEIYRRILDIVPDHVDALNLRGVYLHQVNRTEEGLELIRRALTLEPNASGAWNNLGNLLLTLQRYDEAGEAFERGAALAPDDPDLQNSLGLLRRAQKRHAEAEAAFRRSIELRPAFAGAYINFGHLLSDRGRTREALEQYCLGTIKAPHNRVSRKMIGISYSLLGEFDKAEKTYRDWLVEEPDNAHARHYLAACTGKDVPPRAADAYVEHTFDSFAESFDSKLAKLHYRAPELLADAVAHACGKPAKNLDVLDAGCGTGLCGPLVAGYARELVGVDLSAGMLERARSRKVYDALHKEELGAFLASHDAAYDLVISADTLCYFGALDGVAAAAYAALRPDGWMVFTVEALDPAEAGFRLQIHGRYAHTRAYVDATFTQAGFAAPQIIDVHLRMENGLPVAGLLVTCLRPRPLPDVQPDAEADRS